MRREHGMYEGLSLAETERLIKLQEECAEVIQIAAKVLIYGYEEVNILELDGPNNKERLEKELGDVIYWIEQMYLNKDINEVNILNHADAKHCKAKKYTRYQEGSEWNR